MGGGGDVGLSTEYGGAVSLGLAKILQGLIVKKP
jgi:hypothetical protein